MAKKYIEEHPTHLPWKRVMSAFATHEAVVAYRFGPLVKTVRRVPGQIQVRYYAPNGKLFRTESGLIAHMDRMAAKK